MSDWGCWMCSDRSSADAARHDMASLRCHVGDTPPEDLAELLIAVITGVDSGTDEPWRAIVGPVHQIPVVYNVRSNLAVYPGGTG